MAIRQAVYFSLTFIGDGSATQESTNLNSSPFVFGGIGAVGDPKYFSTLWTATSPMPVDAINIVSSDSQTCTVTIGMLGAVTFSWPNAIPDGDVVTVYGVFRF